MHEFSTPWRDNPLEGIPDVPAPDPADLDLTIARSEPGPAGDIPHEVPIVPSENRGARAQPQEAAAEADSSEPAAEDKPEEWTERTVGKYRVIERVQDHGKGDVVASMRRARDTASFPTESPLTGREKRLIRRVHDAVDLIAEDVGVDALHRIPSVRHYHAFDTPEAYDQALAALGWPEGDESQAAHVGAVGTLFIREPGDGQAATLAHETAHDIALEELTTTIETVQPENLADKPQQHIHTNISTVYGSLTPGERSPLNEFVADSVAVRAMHEMGRFQYPLRYGPIDVLGDAMIHKTARIHRIPPRLIDNYLIKGMLDGDMTGLDMVRDALGQDWLDRFLALSCEENLGDAQRLAAGELGLPRALKTIEQYLKTRELDIFNWS